MTRETKYVQSADMLREELRGRKIKMTRSMDAEERFHQKRMGYVKYCIHMRHNIPLNSIFSNWTSKYVSVKGQIVVKTCQSESLKFTKYQDVESEVDDQMEKWQSKNSSQRLWAVERRRPRRRDEGNTTSSQLHTTTQRTQGSDRCTSEGAASKSSVKLTETFQHAWGEKTTTMKTKREELRTWEEKGEAD